MIFYAQIIIPSNVEALQTEAFAGCSSVQSVKVSPYTIRKSTNILISGGRIGAFTTPWYAPFPKHIVIKIPVRRAVYCKYYVEENY